MRTWLALAASAFIGCAAIPSAVQAQEPPALAAINDPAEKARVQKLIEGAKKEGALSWIGVQIEPGHAGPILEEFKRYYGLADLKGEYTYAGTGEIVTRIEQLLRAKRNNFDIVWTASWAWYQDLLKRGEIMQYESPYYKEYTLSDQNGMSEKGYWVSDAYTFAPIYNPGTLEQRGVKDFKPTSWADFVDPRLAGQLCMIDVLVSTSAAPVLAGIVKTMGDDWLKKLGATKPALHIKAAQGRDWVGSGEFSATLLNSPKDALSLIERNIKTKQVFPKEGVVLIPFAPIILKSAPHPNTAQLFIDFVRSAHGAQTAMNAGSLLFFGRPGVKSKYPDLLPAAEEVKAIPFDWDNEATNAAIKKFRDKVRSVGIGSKS
ncbi:MAG TPA: extracellular solute-binding protein [Xanthobacteraceae bacterium]|nr:extracellular solute-binding protein [Xanthobacteraceae bacterium]